MSDEVIEQQVREAVERSIRSFNRQIGADIFFESKRTAKEIMELMASREVFEKMRERFMDRKDYKAEHPDGTLWDATVWIDKESE